MNPATHHRLTTLISAMCIAGMLGATTPTAYTPATSTTTTHQWSIPAAVEHRDVIRAEITPTRDSPTAKAVSCPSGWFCFYDETDFVAPRGKLSDCGWQYLSDFDWQNRIEAAYYNLSSGSAKFYESNGTYLFQVSAANRSLSNVGTKQNKADKVYRTCTVQ